MIEELNSEISQILELLDEFKGKGVLNEANTKGILIEPMLQALEWEVFDFNDVEKEYPVFGGGSADYALKILGTPEIFIETKKLDKSLGDDRSIRQLNNYVAGTGEVKWGILTNGDEYRLYKSNEVRLDPPDRIVFEVSIEECKDSEEKHLFFIEMMKHLSKDKVESGELDRWASELFLENRIRKIMREPSDEFLNVMKDQIGTSASDEKVKAAMENVLKGYMIQEKGPKPIPEKKSKYKGIKELIAQASKEQLGIFDELENFILSLGDDVQKKETKYYYAYRRNMNFACVEIHPQSQITLIYLKIDPKTLDQMPEIARDVSNIGHYGTGDLELRVRNSDDLEVAKPLIKESYEIG